MTVEVVVVEVIGSVRGVVGGCSSASLRPGRGGAVRLSILPLSVRLPLANVFVEQPITATIRIAIEVILFMAHIFLLG